MATYTTAQMRASGIYPAATDIPGSPGQIMLEYVIDGSKKAIATNDVVTMFDIPTYTGFLVEAASVNVTSAATASCALSIGIAGTDVTGLTAFDATSTAGAQVKLATGANSVITTSGTSSITLKANTAGLGNGVVRVRVFGKLLG